MSHVAEARPDRGWVSVVVRRRTAWLAALLPLVAAVLLTVFLGEATRTPSQLDQLPRGAESTTAVALQQELPDDAAPAVVLFTADSGRLPAGTDRALQAVVDDVRDRFSLLGGPPLSASEDGTAALAVLPLPESGASETAALVTDLRAALDEQVPDGVQAQLTGPAAVEADLAAVFDGANGTLLLTTAAVVAVLLLLTYRSPVLWLVPLVVVGIADRLSAVLATHALDRLGLAWDESTVGILSVLVFGAGTDYALLLISRYRDELRTEEDRYVAMRLALGRTAEAVVSSASTVVLGLLVLLLSLVPTTRGLGLACAVGVVTAAAFVLLVLPPALVLAGRWVFWPRTPRVGQVTLVESRSGWRRVGDLVARRPATWVAAAVLGLAVLSLGVLRIDTGLGPADQFLEEPEAITAAERLAESFPGGSSDPTSVLTRSDPQDVVAALQGVSTVRSAEVTRQQDGLAEVSVVLDADPGSAAAEEAVDAVRDALAGLPETWVGGTEAEAIDARAAAGRDRLVVLPTIGVLVLAALVLLLRSLVAPVLLVATVLATYLASLGIAWWLFTGPLGFAALDVGVPLLAFLFLVALGVDYNIFLVTRAREEAAAHGAREGMLRALTATGGVITSAGILLAAVFAVLGVLPLVVLAQLGLVICIGVLLDTLLVRTVVVPALGVLLGDRFWWPRRVGAPGPVTAGRDDRAAATGSPAAPPLPR